MVMENIHVKVIVSGGVELVNEFTVTQDVLEDGKANEVVESFMGIIAGNITTIMTKKQSEEDSP